jgi:hypothetical protein
MTSPIRMGTDLRSAGVLLVLALLNAGCAELDRRAPQVWNTLERPDGRASWICFTSLDETVISPITSTFSRDPAAGVLAGFRTVFFPGQPPFACDRLRQTTAQGAFHFGVRSIPGLDPVSYSSAVLEIAGAPMEPVSVVFGEPWDLSYGEGWLSSSTPRDNCQFRLSVAAVPPDGGTWGGPTVASTPLAAGSSTFVAPGEMRSFNVTSEVRGWLSGGTETGFVITPASSAINSKSNSSCVVLFTARLRVFVSSGG